MNCFEKALYQILVSFGIDFDSFEQIKDERIKAHKYCYLLSKFFNFPIEGSFSLYINGPYNYHLTDSLYNIAKGRKNIDLSEEQMSDEIKQVTDRIIGVFPNNAHTTSLLEIFTTYDFLRTNYPSLNDNQRFEELRRLKGHLFGSCGLNEVNTEALDNLSRQVGIL